MNRETGLHLRKSHKCKWKKNEEEESSISLSLSPDYDAADKGGKVSKFKELGKLSLGGSILDCAPALPAASVLLSLNIQDS